MKIIVMTILLIFLTSCSDLQVDSSTLVPATSSSGDNGIIQINSPSDFIICPERIKIVKSEAETILLPDEEGYAITLSWLKNRFPEKLQIASTTFNWIDYSANSVDWSAVAKEFDYVYLAFETEQQVSINCLTSSHDNKLYTNVAFQGILFPLSEKDAQVFILLNSGNTFGALNDSADVLAELYNI